MFPWWGPPGTQRKSQLMGAFVLAAKRGSRVGCWQGSSDEGSCPMGLGACQIRTDFVPRSPQIPTDTTCGHYKGSAAGVYGRLAKCQPCAEHCPHASPSSSSHCAALWELSGSQFYQETKTPRLAARPHAAPAEALPGLPCPVLRRELLCSICRSRPFFLRHSAPLD